MIINLKETKKRKLAMQLTKYENPEKFQSKVLQFLLKNEALNCLPIGVIQAIIDKVYKDYHLFVLENNMDLVGVSYCTPPYPLWISNLDAQQAQFMATEIFKNNLDPSGLIGPVESVEFFCRHWETLSPTLFIKKMHMGVYELREVIMPSKINGQMRFASNADSEILRKWSYNFAVDCKVEIPSETELDEIVKKCTLEKSRVFYTVNEQIVSMVNSSGKTPNGIRLNYVYTPPEYRKCGYASELVALYSQHLLHSGNKFCFLFTDMGNPTSNKIYQNLGYQKVGEYCHIEICRR